MVGRRKLPDPSLNCIFNALSIGVQYMLSFQWSNFGLKCLFMCSMFFVKTCSLVKTKSCSKKMKTFTSSMSSRFHHFCLKFGKYLSLCDGYVLAENFYFSLGCKIFKKNLKNWFLDASETRTDFFDNVPVRNGLFW